MSGEITIRQATVGELDEVAALAVEAYAEYAARMSPDAWSAFAQQIGNVRGRIADGEQLVAERNGRLVGTVTLFVPWKGAQEDSYGVRLLAVPPPERGTGVGRALMEYCIDRARRDRKDRVVLTVTQEMESARDLHERLGFVRDPTLDHEPAPGVRALGYSYKVDA